jgi:NAD(P)-dependent dehydrogenase (short-subunit alcohol dehydrogenase family)
VPTILINNAAVVHGKCTWDLTAAEVQRTLAVNLGAHFHTLRTFLPGMLQADGGGTVVTVASVMGKLHAAQLSDYCASKAGLIAMHNALRFELARESAPEGAAFIRTVLVNPGHLATRLFAGVCTTSHFFGPTLEPVELAREIVRKVDAGENGEINSPFYARWIEWNFVLPMGVQKMLRILTGVDEAMGLANEKAAKRE